MAITTAINGYQQNPASPTTYELLFDSDLAGFKPVGIQIWSETGNTEVYFDIVGQALDGDIEPATIVAGAQPIQFIFGGKRGLIDKVYARGAATAQVSWITNIQG